MSNCRIILALLGISLWFTGRATAAQNVHAPELSDLPERPEPEMPTGQTDEGSGLVLPNTDIIRDTGKVFYTPSTGGRLEPGIGGLRMELPTDLLQTGLSYNSPFQQGTRPTGAEIRLGRLYLNLLSLSTSVLYSDNIDRTEFNREDGVIGIVELDVLGTLQFTDNLRLAFRVGLIYLPFKNKFGVAGISSDEASGRLFYGSAFSHLAQLTYDLRLGGQLQIYDHLRAVPPLLAERFAVVNGNTFDEEDRTGRYVFRSRVQGPPNGGNDLRVNETDRHFGEPFLQVVNTAGASINRLLPTSTRLELGAYHSDTWYYGGDDSQLPHSRDGAYVALHSERESMRFQPFATYRIFRSDEQKWNEEVRGGIGGPVTENIQLLGSIGYLWNNENDTTRTVGNVRLQHTIGPLTVQQFEYRRDLAYPEEDLEDSYTYRVRQTLGPYLYGEAFGQYATFEDLNNNNTGSEERRVGVHFTSLLSSRATFRVGGVFSRLNYNNPGQGDVDKWTVVTQLRYRLSEPWETAFTYQYQKYDSSVPGDSYYEHLFVFTLTYFFKASGSGGSDETGTVGHGRESEANAAAAYETQ